MKQSDLRDKVAQLNRVHGITLEIGWAYGKPRVTDNDGGRDVSPRLPMGQMNLWLDAFEAGMSYEKPSTKKGKP